MTFDEFTYLQETAEHDAAIEAINAEAFGPGRFTRAAYRIREQGGHERSLSYVAADQSGEIIGSVRMTPICAGAGHAILLGPLAVRPAFKNAGIGRRLMTIAIDTVRETEAAPAVILVGDLPYYNRVGFERLSHGKVSFPGPVDPSRILGLELKAGGLDALTGEIVHASRRRKNQGLKGSSVPRGTTLIR